MQTFPSNSISFGALPSQTLREMFEAGIITGADAANIAPASLDLTLSDEVYKTSCLFQLRQGETVRELLREIDAKPHPTEKAFERGATYIARLNESAALPKGVYGYCNPKSSTGRVDVHVRVLADGVPRYDSLVPGGWRGELWIAIHPKSFSVKMNSGIALSQLRLFTADTRFSQLDLHIAMERDKLLWDAQKNTALQTHEMHVGENDGAPVLSLDFDAAGIVGWVSKNTQEVLDMSQVGAHAPDTFFEIVYAKKEGVLLEREKFYILSTEEAVRIPPTIACEMAPMDERSGDFRSHYAGFIDPGWGWGKEGDAYGKQLTLEVRPFEDLFIRPKQPIAKIKFEKMAAVPDVLYDTRASNYVHQRGPRLSKHFLV